MNDLATKLRTSTSTAAINQRAIETEMAAARLANESRNRFGKVDVDQLQTRLSQLPRVDQQMLRAIEARLTPVEAGQLARLRDASGANIVRITPSSTSSALTQARLTPVQQGEMERLALTQDLNISTTPSTKSFFGDLGDFFTGGNEGGDFFNEIGVPIALPDDPPSSPVAPPPPPAPSSTTPPKKEPIPGERDPDDDVRPTPPSPPPPSSGSGSGAVPVSPPLPPSSGAGDPYLTPPQSLTDQAHRQLQEEGPPSDISSLFGRTNNDKLDLLTGVTEGEASSPWADALNGFKDSAITAIPNQNARIAAAFGTGLVEGVAGGVLDAAEGIAKLTFNAAQFYEDGSVSGYLGDELRGVTGELPKWLDAIIPSHQRGIETAHYTEQVADNIGAYVGTRIKDPSLLRDDVKDFLSTHWNELKDDHAAARAKGPEAEAEWWGKTIGRGAFEVAATVTAVGDVAKLARAGAGIAKLAIEAGVEYTAAKLGEISTYAKDLTSAAKTAAASDELSVAGLEDLQASKKKLTEFQLFEAENLPNTSEGQKTLADLKEAETAVDNAIAKGERLESPTTAPVTLVTTQAGVELLPKSQAIYDSFDSLSALKEGNSSFVKLDSNTPLSDLSKNLANLTDKYGVEFAVFKRGDKIILARGDANGIDIPQAFRDSIESGITKGNKWQLLAHTQPGYDVNSLRASAADQSVLKLLGQTTDSAIINSRGQSATFTQDTAFKPDTVTHINKKTFTSENALYNQTNDASKLQPYARYEYNGYRYETDSQGRVVSASGELQLNPPNTPRKHTNLQTQIGHEGRPQVNGKYPDVGFHLIGHQFKGEVNYLNVVPGDAVLNGNSAGKYGALENALAKDVDDGYRVEVNIQVNYGSSTIEGRPESFTFNYRTTTAPYGNTFGQWASQTFVNK
jgi:DNA/RNA non-specific endonuclease